MCTQLDRGPHGALDMMMRLIVRDIQSYGEKVPLPCVPFPRPLPWPGGQVRTSFALALLSPGPMAGPVTRSESQTLTSEANSPPLLTLPLSQSPVLLSPSRSRLLARVWASCLSISCLSGEDDAGREETASASRREARWDDDGEVEGDTLGFVGSMVLIGSGCVEG